MGEQIEIRNCLGQRLRRRRQELAHTLDEIAAKAEISASYLSEIETGKCIPPPSTTMKKILDMLEFCETEAYELAQLATIARGLAYGEADLPPETQALIRDIRAHAHRMSPRFIKGLQSAIREAVKAKQSF